ncbi:MAG: dTDP-glucose 4,6-dehydratase, dTDP-glucose 4,6-dehydratase [Candidatus Peregrinibacteria bacterium GW2011_GWF2_33_10]|nr:MAG: dTDP-glucose 4,6-dehydratase, dTDP-glucose 4,6-dehydratase [Candidatus Peregrinibacteria bacterium GW2011_GWF2_33_10]OGJ44952.1 MAG: dTDP-glucose 4,6-dehydratase [Candidatus Peregrinibacteria bacterium RIFOXYA12_FULL_33_12]OGJ45250.1 MAG: dTDP-glucose 4,6-dehydratase [Candidatus Peregrinibacteria bacterium RIFOXYA2_FULL_33_21]OGJ51174.1 MAG: dTDP-glucose 4,6-dehydratase [Candidatus Peregrinibacteria bacterium RIFOXYB2_FULL_33_20]
MTPKTILVTGGAGFIGANYLNKYVRLNPNIHYICVDKLTYAGSLDNLEIKDLPNFTFEKIDIVDKPALKNVFEKYTVDGIIHFAAESHVDNSIANPDIFVMTNVIGTANLLDLALKYNVKKFHHISTDEVYGELGANGYFTEESPYKPNSPYSASKAGSDHLVRAYHETYGLNTTISNCSNNYGPYQHEEKLIPLFIKNLIHDKKVPLYSTGQNIRDWIYVEDHCDAVDLIFREGKSGETYLIGAKGEKTNLEITKILLKAFGKDESYIQNTKDRKGHDFRYAINSSKLKKELGWTPKMTFENGIKKTIEWYKRKFLILNS